MTDRLSTFMYTITYFITKNMSSITSIILPHHIWTLKMSDSFLTDLLSSVKTMTLKLKIWIHTLKKGSSKLKHFIPSTKPELSDSLWTVSTLKGWLSNSMKMDLHLPKSKIKNRKKRTPQYNLLIKNITSNVIII